jgi:hypothetical protein
MYFLFCMEVKAELVGMFTNPIFLSADQVQFFKNKVLYDCG